jgi:hypothetical protein
VLALNLTQTLENLGELLNPNPRKAVEKAGEISLDQIWVYILQRAGLKNIEYDPAKLCEQFKDILNNTVNRLERDARLHNVVKNTLRDLGSKIKTLSCPNSNELLEEKIDKTKKLIGEFTANVYKVLDCRRLCSRESGRGRDGCVNDCNRVLVEIIDAINSMGFLLDTCYDKERFRKLYGKVKNLLGCPRLDAHSKCGIALLLVTVTLLTVEGHRGVAWLYTFISEKLGLPEVPWIGDVVALIYAVADIAREIVHSKIEFNVNMVGDLVAKLVACR